MSDLALQPILPSDYVSAANSSPLKPVVILTRSGPAASPARSESAVFFSVQGLQPVFPIEGLQPVPPSWNLQKDLPARDLQPVFPV